MIEAVRAALVATALGGCWAEGPTTLGFAMSSFSWSPVLVTEAKVEGIAPLPIKALVVAASAEDLSVPRDLGTYSMDWAAGANDSVTVHATWVELLTDRAWEAAVDISPRDLTQRHAGTASLTLVFGPHGEMIVASDPLPDEGPRRDLVQVCGQRKPSADRDIAAEADAIAQLASTLALTFPPVPTDTRCPEPRE
jgi:hypothetical protein